MGAIDLLRAAGTAFDELLKAKKQPLHSISHRKAGPFIKVAEEGKSTDWVPAHQVEGRWEPKPEGAPKKRGGRKAVAAPAPAPAPVALPAERDETLVWYKDSGGVKAGAVHKHGSKWVVIISAKAARSRRLTSRDEDMGWGHEGGRLTEQRVKLRDALPHEVEAEEKRRADKQAAAAAATPRGQFDAWREAHPEASPAPEHMTPTGVKWTEVRREGEQTFLTGEGPDGASWAKLVSSSYDNHRVSYLRTPADPEKLVAVTKQHDHARALLDWIAETGTYTDADVPHLTDDLHQELYNNRWELESPNRLRTDEHGNPVYTKDDHRATVLRQVRDAHRALGPMAGTRDLAFEHAHRDAIHTLGMSTYGPHIVDALGKMRGAAIPPKYAELVADRVARGEATLAEVNAAEEKERQEQERAPPARATARRSTRSPSASFTKLRDGSWGVRVDGDADEGDTVTVRRRDGSKESKRLGRLVHDGGDYKLFKMTKAGSGTALEALRMAGAALLDLLKGNRFVYSETAPANPAGWEPPNPPRRATWRWDTQAHGGPPPEEATKRKRKRKAPAKAAEPATAKVDAEEPALEPTADKPTEMRGAGEIRDVGDVLWDARKHRAWKRGQRVDTGNIEHVESMGEAEARRIVTKQAVFGPYDHDADRQNGDSPAASYLKARIIDAVASAPHSSAEARAAYVTAARWLQHELAALHTVADVRRFVHEWHIMASGAMLDERTFTTKELLEHLAQNRNAGSRLDRRSYGFVTVRDPTDMVPDPVAARLLSEGVTKEELRRRGYMLERPREHRIDYADLAGAGYADTVLRLGDGRVRLTRPLPPDQNSYRRAACSLAGQALPELPAHGAQFYPLLAKKADYSNRLLRLVGTNPAMMGRRSPGAFYETHIPAATEMDRRGEEGWDLLTKKKAGGGGQGGGKAWVRHFAGVTRTGGAPIPSEVTGDTLRETFGFRGVQYGNWVEQEARTEHMRNAHGALLDLADMMGVEPKQLTHSGALGLAFGARGGGNAAAHYEPDRVVINLTHTNGAGTIAHEFAHFFDHQLTTDPGAWQGSGTKTRAPFLSHGEGRGSVHADVDQAFRDVMDAIHLAPAQPGRYRRQQTQFVQDAEALGKAYWASSHELFARAFESYIEDDLERRERRNTYLVSGTQQKYRIPKGGRDVEPYPHGDERARIHGAIRKLVEAMARSGALRKALARLRGERRALDRLTKARRARTSDTVQVSAHVAHDAHGTHMVAAHVRHLTAREAIRLKAGELRDHAAAGGESGAVAQAEIDRRAAKRAGAAPEAAPVARARAASRRADEAREQRAKHPSKLDPAPRLSELRAYELVPDPVKEVIGVDEFVTALRSHPTAIEGGKALEAMARERGLTKQRGKWIKATDAAPRRAPAAPEGPALPSWVPKPKRGGRYSKAEMAEFRRTMYHGDHPEIRQLHDESAAFTRDMNAWAERQSIPLVRIPFVLVGDRYTTERTAKSSNNVFGSAIHDRARDRGHWLNHWAESKWPEDKARYAAASTPAGLVAWWGEYWRPYAEHVRADMAWWRANRDVMSPLRDVDAVVEALRHGYAGRHVTEQQAEHVLRDVHGLDFIARAGRSAGSTETPIGDLLKEPGERGAVSLAAARQKHDQETQAAAEKRAHSSAALHAAASQVSQAMKALAARGKKPHHSASLTRAIPGLRIEVTGKQSSGHGYEVIMEGGPFDYTGRGGWRFIGPPAPTREAAWSGIERMAHAIAAAPDDLDAHDYFNMRKARRGAATALRRALARWT